MRVRKGFVKALCAVLLLALLGVEVYMELRFSYEEVTLKSEDAAAIFRRTPEAEITTEDRALLNDVFQCPGVQEVWGSMKNRAGSMREDPDVKSAAAPYLGAEIAGCLAVDAFQKDGVFSECLYWEEDEKNVFSLEWILGDGKDAYYKTYCRTGLFGRRTFYENWDNERAQKSVIHHRWFAWIQDRMWEVIIVDFAYFLGNFGIE